MGRISASKQIFSLVCIFFLLSCATIPTVIQQVVDKPTPASDEDAPIPTVPAELSVISPTNADRIELITKLGGFSAIDVKWDPNNKWLVLLTSQGVEIRDPNTLELIKVLPDSRSYSDGTITFSPDGKYLASTLDREVEIAIWETENWTRLRDIDQEPRGAHNIMFSVDGTMLAYISNARIMTQDLDTGQLSVDGTNTVYLVDPQSGDLLHIFPGGISNILDIAFSPDGGMLASGSCCEEPDRIIRLWDTQSGKLIHEFEDRSFFDGKSLIFSRNGTSLHISNESSFDLRTYEYADQNPFWNAEEIIYSPDSSHLAIGIRGGVKVFGAENLDQQSVLELGTDELVQRISFSSDGKQLAYLANHRLGIWNFDSKLPLIRTITDANGKAFAVSADSRILAKANNGGRVTVFDLDTQQERDLSSGVEVRFMQFSRNGLLLAIGRGDDTIEIWDLQQDKQITSISDATIQDNLTFAANDSILLAWNYEGNSTLWSVSDGRKILENRGNGLLGAGYFLAQDTGFIVIRENADMFISDVSLSILDMETGSEFEKITLPNPYVFSFAITSDAKQLIYNELQDGATSQLVFFDLERKQEVARYPLEDIVLGITVLDRNNNLVLTGEDRTYIWDAISKDVRFETDGGIGLFGNVEVINERYLLDASGILDTQTGEYQEHQGVSYSWDNGIAATFDQQSVVLKDMNDGSELARFIGHDSTVSNVVISKNGKYLISGSEQANEIRVWDISVRASSLLDNQISADALIFSPDHATLVFSDSAQLKFFDTESAKVTETIEGQLFDLGLGFTPDGNYLITTGPLWKSLMIRDGGTGKLLSTLDFELIYVYAMSFSHDSTTLAIVSSDVVSIIDLAAGVETSKFTLDVSDVNSAVFTPDNQQLVIADQDGTVSWWNISEGSKLNEVELPGVPLLLSPTGDAVLLANIDTRELQVWNLESLEKLWGYEHEDIEYLPSMDYFLFSPDGKILVFPDLYGILTFWDTATGNILYTFEDIPWGDLAFSQDGMLFGIAAGDEITIWGAK